MDASHRLLWLIQLPVLLAALSCQPGDSMLPDTLSADTLELLKTTPDRGPSGGGVQIVLSGRGFSANASVSIGGVSAPVIAVQSDKELTVTLPRALGAMGLTPVTVTNPDGKTVTRGDLFLYHLGITAMQAPVRLLPKQLSQALLVFDANRDGRQDIITLEPQTTGTVTSTTMSALVTNLANKDGTYTAKPSAATFEAQFLHDFWSADLNRDGITDLIQLNKIRAVAPRGLRIRTLTGTGSGDFIDAAQLDLPRYSEGVVALGDINGDSRSDLLVSVPGLTSGHDIELYFTQSDGTLALGQSFSVTDTPINAAILDANGDSRADIALVLLKTSLPCIELYVGQADGTFALTGTTPITPPDSVSAIAVAELSGDGIADFITIGTTDTVVLRKGTASGVFDNPLPIARVPGSVPTALRITDIDRDGALDLSLTYSSGVGVALSNGGTTFGPIKMTSIEYLSAVNHVDLDGDGKQDLVALQTSSPQRLVLYAKGFGDGTFRSYSSIPLGSQFYKLAAADFDGDGKAELVGVCSSGLICPKGVGLISRSASGQLDQLRYLSTDLAAMSGSFAEMSSMNVSDVDHDGAQDIVGIGSSAVVTWIGRGDGTFLPPQISKVLGSANLGCRSFNCSTLADLNRDGIPEFIQVRSSEVYVHMGLSGGFFGSFTIYPTGPGAVSVAALDLDQDGNLDLVTANPTSFNLGLLLGRADGRLQATQYIPLRFAPAFVLAGDVDRDGLADLIVTSNATNDLAVLRSRKDGSVPAPRYYDDAGTIGTATAQLADLNGDGAPELLIVTGKNIGDLMPSTTSILRIFLNAGDGTFSGYTEYAVGQKPGEVAVLDMNGDGKLDLAVADPLRYGFSYIYNISE